MAYTSLAKELRHRDQGEFQLNLFHHVQRLQRIYAAALEEGWTAEEMASEASMSWMYDNVAWHIEQDGAIHFDDQYYALAYDDSVKSGVLIDADPRADLQARFDAVDKEGRRAGSNGHQAAQVTGMRTPKSPWAVDDDHDLLQ